MRTYRRTVTAAAAPEQVWAYLADFTTINEWDSRAGNSRRVTGDGGVGSDYVTDVRFLGRITRMTSTITHLDPHRRIEWAGRHRAVDAYDVIDLREEDGNTVVDYSSAYSYRVAPRLMDRLMARPLARLCDDARDGLRRTLASR